jgi:predicted RNA binding protein YcfA (HicA-like mRNA interferase family)
MSPKQPVVSGSQAVKALQRAGYQVIRQRRSHIRLRDETNPQHLPVTIPDQKTLKPGLLHKILRDANLTVEVFLDLLK